MLNPEQRLINECLTKAIINPKHLINAQRKLGIQVAVEKVKHYLVTIQFIEESFEDEERIKEIPVSLLRMKYFKANDYWYSYERHSKVGINNHIHFLIKQTNHIISQSKIIRDVRAKYKDIIKTVNVQSSPCSTHFQNRLSYITDLKKDGTKDEFAEQDRLWRNKYSLDRYYTNTTSDLQ